MHFRFRQLLKPRVTSKNKAIWPEKTRIGFLSFIHAVGEILLDDGALMIKGVQFMLILENFNNIMFGCSRDFKIPYSIYHDLMP